MTDEKEYDLRLSKEKVGALVPILKDAYGNTIDGLHREEIDPKWPSIKLEHIRDPVQLTMARLISNVARRDVNAEEKTNLLNELARLTGWKIPKIANEIGMSEDFVRKYISDEFKHKEMQVLARRRHANISFNPIPFTVWNISGCAKGFGVPDFPGRIPAQIVMNILYYYTKENDLVVDPMAGSGTTYDVCQYLRRRPLCYDIAPIRPEIKKHDIRNGFPSESKGCDLIFLDPPYFKKLQKEERYNILSEVTRQEFIEFMAKLAKDSFQTLKQFGYVALIVSDYIEGEESLLTTEYYNAFKEAGFKPFNRIQCPLSTQQYAGHQRKKAIETKQILNISRDLYIFKK